jgi:RNA polymerase sigma-70 factor (ECF subfamily)
VLVIRLSPATSWHPVPLGPANGPTIAWSRTAMTNRDDVDRFDELYTRFGATIYARCRQMLRDPAAAQDATQEVFLRIHRTLEQIRGPREAYTWLYRTATNHCLNEIRNGKLRPTLMAALPERAGPPAEAPLCDQDLVARLVRAVPEELATAAWLYHVDELEQGEIATICGVSRRTIINRLARFNTEARAFIERSEHVVAK